jgi:hypothetical protein
VFTGPSLSTLFILSFIQFDWYYLWALIGYIDGIPSPTAVVSGRDDKKIVDGEEAVKHVIRAAAAPLHREEDLSG